jgi:hypothetical protein
MADGSHSEKVTCAPQSEMKRDNKIVSSLSDTLAKAALSVNAMKSLNESNDDKWESGIH